MRIRAWNPRAFLIACALVMPFAPAAGAVPEPKTKAEALKVLGLDASADSDAIKKRYRAMAMQYHPDRNPGNKAAEDMLKAVNVAYGIITEKKMSTEGTEKMTKEASEDLLDKLNSVFRRYANRSLTQSEKEALKGRLKNEFQIEAIRELFKAGRDVSASVGYIMFPTFRHQAQVDAIKALIKAERQVAPSMETIATRIQHDYQVKSIALLAKAHSGSYGVSEHIAIIGAFENERQADAFEILVKEHYKLENFEGLLPKVRTEIHVKAIKALSKLEKDVISGNFDRLLALSSETQLEALEAIARKGMVEKEIAPLLEMIARIENEHQTAALKAEVHGARKPNPDFATILKIRSAEDAAAYADLRQLATDEAGKRQALALAAALDSRGNKELADVVRARVFAAIPEELRTASAAARLEGAREVLRKTDPKARAKVAAQLRNDLLITAESWPDQLSVLELGGKDYPPTPDQVSRVFRMVIGTKSTPIAVVQSFYNSYGSLMARKERSLAALQLALRIEPLADALEFVRTSSADIAIWNDVELQNLAKGLFEKNAIWDDRKRAFVAIATDLSREKAAPLRVLLASKAKSLGELADLLFVVPAHSHGHMLELVSAQMGRPVGAGELYRMALAPEVPADFRAKLVEFLKGDFLDERHPRVSGGKANEAVRSYNEAQLDELNARLREAPGPVRRAVSADNLLSTIDAERLAHYLRFVMSLSGEEQLKVHYLLGRLPTAAVTEAFREHALLLEALHDWENELAKHGLPAAKQHLSAKFGIGFRRAFMASWRKQNSFAPCLAYARFLREQGASKMQNIAN